MGPDYSASAPKASIAYDALPVGSDDDDYDDDDVDISFNDDVVAYVDPMEM